MKRLDKNMLSTLPAGTILPSYDRDRVGTGIVHLGIGAFHRAHQACYTDMALCHDATQDWGITGVSLRGPGVRDQLVPQAGLYSLVEKSATGDRIRIVGAVKDVLVAPENPEAVVLAMSSPQVRIVSLTITEKGYCHDPATGMLNTDHPDIQHDLRDASRPRTAIGFIVASLQRRRQSGLPGFTALSCDNLPHNGALLRTVVAQFATSQDPELAAWIESNVTFPCTMVDRIAPAVSDEDRLALEAGLGVQDAAMVVTEPFTQWVLEDDFIQGRPRWEEGGALFVADVSGFEEMKLRLLNGCHSLLAYTGYLAGYDYISQVITDPAFLSLAERYMDDEVTPTLSPPADFDIAAYKKQLLQRFNNTALKHRTWQIAMDGSQKLPQRILNTVRDRLESGQSIRVLALAVAAWIFYTGGTDEAGEPITVSDPMAGQLKACFERNTHSTEAIVRAYVSIAEIFGDDLIAEPVFIDEVGDCLRSIRRHGIRSLL